MNIHLVVIEKRVYKDLQWNYTNLYYALSSDMKVAKKFQDIMCKKLRYRFLLDSLKLFVNPEEDKSKNSDYFNKVHIGGEITQEIESILKDIFDNISKDGHKQIYDFMYAHSMIQYFPREIKKLNVIGKVNETQTDSQNEN